MKLRVSNGTSTTTRSTRSPDNDCHSSTLIPITRRRFCNGLLLTSTGLVLTQTVVGQSNSQSESLVQYPPMKIDGAEKLTPGSGLYFEYPTGKDPAVLVRTIDGDYMAYSRKCSHAGCSVEFDAARRCFKCPCHQGVYDPRAGYVMFGPPRKPLEQIVLQVRSGGQVWAVGKILGRTMENIARK